MTTKDADTHNTPPATEPLARRLLTPEREEVERINALGCQHIDQMNLVGALELVAFARAVQAAERERIAAHFDERDRGSDGKPLGIGFYDPHEPAEIIRALGPNVELSR